MPHSHIRRLDRVWVRDPLFFLTVCTAKRRIVLANPSAAAALIEEWSAAKERHGWHIGAYVIMPDHVHFFAEPDVGAKELSVFIGKWKEWTAKKLLGLKVAPASPVWQPEFFDHVLRSEESCAEKWEYVKANPVRAGLVKTAAEWPYWGHIHFA